MFEGKNTRIILFQREVGINILAAKFSGPSSI
jgi:hypothetical protein